MVLIAAAKAGVDLREMVNSALCLHVRGKVVARWSVHLSKAYAELNIPGVKQADASVLEAWRAHEGVPEALLENVMAAATEEQAERIMAGIRGQQQGYANTM